MGLSSDLISQFAKLAAPKKETKSETIKYGKAITVGNTVYVQIDGSNTWTPASTTSTIKAESADIESANPENGERVAIMLKDHTATVLGNTSIPSASSKDVAEQGKTITELDIVVAHNVTTDDLTAINASINNIKAITGKYGELSAIEADIESLLARIIDAEYISTKDMDIVSAEIDVLKARIGEFTDISSEDLNAINAEIDNLKAYNATFDYVEVKRMSAIDANIQRIQADKLNAKNADIKYVNIDFGNIDRAWLGEFFAKSGVIENATLQNGVITGDLVGVRITGDLIDAETIKADKLVLKGEGGLYYQMNISADGVVEGEEVSDEGIDGRVIVAESITADKVRVSDLIAFCAQIGGFNIGSNSIYSGVKESVNNDVKGLYMDTDGQVAIGDSNNYIKFFKETKYYATGYDFDNDCYTSSELELNVDPSEYVFEIQDGVLTDIGEQVYSCYPPNAMSPSWACTIRERYKLKIAADSVMFSGSDANDLRKLTEHVKIGTTEENGDEKPCVDLSEGDSDFKMRITNTRINIMDGADVRTSMDTEGVDTDNVIIRKEERHPVDTNNYKGEYVWATRANGNFGLMWKGAIG